MRVIFLDFVDFPLARPKFHRLFSLDRRKRVIKLLEIDKTLYIILLSESGDDPFFVLKNAAHQIIGDANVKRPIGFAR